MRIANIADTHLTVPDMESESLFPHQLVAMKIEDARMLYERMRKAIEVAFQRVLCHMSQNGNWAFIFHMGDVTGGWREGGCHYPSAERIMAQTAHDLKAVCPRVRLCVGNHDVGYGHPMSQGGGINEDSIAVCQEHFGDLFWKEEDEGVLHIGVASPIAEYAGQQVIINELKRRQNEFIGDSLVHGKPWILYLHRALSCVYFAREIYPHLDSLQRVVCGDLHNPRRGRILKRISWAPVPLIAMSQKMQVLVRCLRKVVVCPSTAPLWYHGHSYMDSWVGRSEFLQEISVPIAPESFGLPTVSTLRCLWWMFRPH
jgi:hypothetical protein